MWPFSYRPWIRVGIGMGTIWGSKRPPFVVSPTIPPSVQGAHLAGWFCRCPPGAATVAYFVYICRLLQTRDSEPLAGDMFDTMLLHSWTKIFVHKWKLYLSDGQVGFRGDCDACCGNAGGRGAGWRAGQQGRLPHGQGLHRWVIEKSSKKTWSSQPGLFKKSIWQKKIFFFPELFP